MNVFAFYETVSQNQGKRHGDHSRHKAYLDAFLARKEILVIDPFADRAGSMGVLKGRASAKAG